MNEWRDDDLGCTVSLNKGKAKEASEANDSGGSRPVECFKELKARRAKFRRQHSVGPYVLDFFCVEESLAIELDGQAHRNEFAEAHDLLRGMYLKRHGIRIMRFENFLILDEFEYVLHRIKENFKQGSPPG